MQDCEAELQRRRLIPMAGLPQVAENERHCEHFNRTLQESFVDFHENLLFTDRGGLPRPGRRVFHNTERPHQARLLQAPMQAPINNHPKRHMLWT